MRTENEVTAYDLNSALRSGADHACELLRHAYEKRIENGIQRSLKCKYCIDPAFHKSDVTQDTFLAVLLFLRNYVNGLYKTEISNPRGLLHTISTCRIYDHFNLNRCRDSYRTVHLEDLDGWVSDKGRFVKQILLKQECDFLMVLAGKILSKEHQNALEDIRYGLTDPERAKKRGISVSKAKQDRYRAIHKFRQALEGMGILGGENNE